MRSDHGGNRIHSSCCPEHTTARRAKSLLRWSSTEKGKKNLSVREGGWRRWSSTFTLQPNRAAKAFSQEHDLLKARVQG